MTPFTRTHAALDADGRSRSLIGFGVVFALAAAWVGWFVLARVSLYEVTDTARLETDRAAHAVQAPVDGRLVSSSLALGRRVQAGDELARVESDAQQLQQNEQRARLASLDAQLQALRRESMTTEQAGRDEQQATLSSLDVARSQVREAEAPAAFAAQDAARIAKLRADGLIAESEAARSQAEADQRRAAAESARLTLARLQREQATRDRDREARLQRLRGDAVRLEGDMAAVHATIDRLQFEIDRRTIRAAVAGELAEVAVLTPGGFLKEGDTLAAIVPTGALRIVAEYPPASALGRVRPGQPARLRLQGFPWMQYGTLAATVDRVAGEVRNGTVRVEFVLASASAVTVPVQHGLPGSIEVEVERISPARLALRLAGRIATSRN